MEEDKREKSDRMQESEQEQEQIILNKVKEVKPRKLVQKHLSVAYERRDGPVRPLHEIGILSPEQSLLLQKSQINTSVTKQTFSFSKANRFASKSIFESNASLNSCHKSSSPIKLCPKAVSTFNINHHLHQNFSSNINDHLTSINISQTELKNPN